MIRQVYYCAHCIVVLVEIVTYEVLHKDIYSSDKEYEETVGLQSIAPHSMLVEIGPIAQGLLRHDIYDTMQSVCNHAQDYIHKHNTENYSFHGKIETFQRGTMFNYPVDENNNITHIDRLKLLIFFLFFSIFLPPLTLKN